MIEGAFLDHMMQMITPVCDSYEERQGIIKEETFKCYLSLLPDDEIKDVPLAISLYEYDSKMPSIQTMGNTPDIPIGLLDDQLPSLPNLTVCECFCLMIYIRPPKDLKGIIKENYKIKGHNYPGDKDEDDFLVPSTATVSAKKQIIDQAYPAARKLLNRIYKHLNGRTSFRPRKVDMDGEPIPPPADLLEEDLNKSNYIYQYIHAKQPPYQMGIDENERNLLVCNFMVYRSRYD